MSSMQASELLWLVHVNRLTARTGNAAVRRPLHLRGFVPEGYILLSIGCRSLELGIKIRMLTVEWMSQRISNILMKRIAVACSVLALGGYLVASDDALLHTR